MTKGERLFLLEANGINNSYSRLQAVKKDGKTIISGELDLKDESGILHDSYSVEIHSVQNYPNRFPLVFETSNRIPRNIDWHVFETDGHCCISTYPEEILACREGLNLIEFVENQVKPYFYSQTFRRLNGYFLSERSHGFLGNIEFFSDLLMTDNIENMIRWLYSVLQREEPNRVAKKCFCGSHAMYRHCHRSAYKKLAAFSDEELKYFIDELYKTASKLRQS